MRAGDTLYSVARRHGVTPMELLAVNPNISPSNVRIGTVVRIPYAGMSAKAANAAAPRAAMPGEAAPIDSVPDSAPLSLTSQMRTLWEQRVWWMRELMICILAGLAGEAEVTSRLLMNPDQIAALFRPAFGDPAARTLSRLLTDHLVIGAELIKASKENDAEAAEDANRRWNENADAIASALASLGPQFHEEAARQMLYRHLDLAREGLAARLAGDHARDISAFDAIQQQALLLADLFSQGIARADG